MQREIENILENITIQTSRLQGKRAEVIYILSEIEDTADDELMTDKDFREWVRKKASSFKKTL